jgi:hypothetical protein
MILFSRAFIRKRVISLATTASVTATSFALADNPPRIHHLRRAAPIQYGADCTDMAGIIAIGRVLAVSSTPGGAPTNCAALPLSTPESPSSPPPGTILPVVAQLGGTSIDPTMAVMPTPNTSACAEGMTMNVATPGTMAPANATGATAIPGVSSVGC